jgi:hypothetical protein
MRIPTWAEGYTVTLNGDKKETREEAGFACLSHSFCAGDMVDIRFETKVRLLSVNDDCYARKHPLAVRYGPLLYSYHIPEDWQIYTPRFPTKAATAGEKYMVWATFDPASGADAYEQRGRKRDKIGWNVALDEGMTHEDFVIEEREAAGYVWEDPPVRLHTRAYKAIYHCPPYPYKTFEPYGEYLHVTHELPITLVPYGCTNLRVTYFPKADISTLKK